MTYYKIILLVLFPFCLLAQQPYLRQFTNENGLPSMIIYEMSQDKDGFLWIGTENGFCRYDGNEFIVYENNEAKDKEFVGVYISPSNVVWTWNMSGQLFIVENNELVFFKGKNLPNDFLTNKVVGDSEGNIFIASYNWRIKYYYLCDKDDNCTKKKNFNSDKTTYDFLKSSFNTNKSLKTIRKSTFFGFKASKHNQEIRKFFVQNLASGGVHYFHEENDTIFFYITDAKFVGAIYFDGIIPIIKKHYLTDIIKSLNLNEIKAIYVDNEKRWWINDNERLFLLKSKEKKMSQNPVINHLDINTIMQDDEDGYWLGTNGKGLYYMPNFQIVSYSEQNSDLSDNSIVEILESPKGEAFIFSKSGNVFSYNNNKVTKAHSLKNPLSLAIYNPKQKNYYVLHQNQFDVFTEDFKSLTQEKVTIGAIKDVLELDDRFYFVNQESFFFLNKEERNLISLKKTNNILAQRGYALLKAIDNKIWVGTINGLFNYNGKELEHFQSSSGDSLKVWINDIEQDREANLWITTENDGVFKINKNKTVEQFLEANGIASNSCEKIFIDNQDNIWITSNSGLTYYDKKSKQFFIIDRTNGLPADLVKGVYVKDNKVWVGTTKGLSVFDKSDIIASNYKLPIKITKIIFDQIPQPIDSFYSVNRNLNNIQFEFISSTFKHGGKIRYKYKMSGIDEDWQETTSNTVLYNHLGSGHYTFQVAALDRFGQISDNIETIKIFIPTPYWQKWWFYLLMGLFGVGTVLGLIYTAFKIYKARKDKEIAVSKKIGELRINALQSQMNPHFTFNALNAIQNFFTTNEREMAMMYLSKFARLIRLSFEYSKQSTISLDKEIDFLKLYLKLEELRFQDKIAFNFQTNDLTNINDIQIPPLLIQPIVENAFKHGLLHKETDGKLDLIFKQENEDTIYCVIEDNGIGRKNAAKFAKWKPTEYKSSGIQTVQERIELINQENEQTTIRFKITDLMDDAKNPRGTRVEFWFKSLN